MGESLRGKTFVIIGGTAGLGLSASLAVIAEGANVVAVGRHPQLVASAKSQIGKNGWVLTADAIHPGTAMAAIECAITNFGAFDGLYHVAGGSARKQGDGPLHEMTDEGIHAAIELNLVSLMYSNRAAVRTFRERKTGGVVLNLSSVLGFSPSKFHFATHAYATTKAAAIGFTQSCAAYYAADQIRFNVLAPGLVETPMAERAARDETIMRFIHTKQPLDGGRIGQPQDLDAAVVFLLSDAARFVTGQVLSVDGGWSVSEGQLS